MSAAINASGGDVATWRTPEVGFAHSRRAAVLAGLVAILALGDAVWNAHKGLSLPCPWGMQAGAIGVGLVSLFYSTLRPAPALAEAAGFVVLWIGFTYFGASLTYLAATLDFPLRDALFAHLDGSLGFDWIAWTGFVGSHKVLKSVLAFSYASFLLQLAVSVLLFSMLRVRGRNEELWLIAFVSILLTTLLFALLPAFGPFRFYGADWFNPFDVDLAALRAGDQKNFASFNGLIGFPSFHATMALVFAYVHRDQRWTAAPFLVLNLLMLVSTPSEGGHFLVDILGGLVVGCVSIAAARAIQNGMPLDGASSRRPMRHPA